MGNIPSISRYTMDSDSYQGVLVDIDTHLDEVGGAMVLDHVRRSFRRPPAHLEIRGEHRAVDGVPDDVVEYHYHHGSCDDKARRTCYLQIPSSWDMYQIARLYYTGVNQAHIVFSPDFTYVVQLLPSLRDSLNARGPDRGAQYLEERRKQWAERVERFVADPHQSYDDFKRDWFRRMNDEGFSVTEFPRGVPPSVFLVA